LFSSRLVQAAFALVLSLSSLAVVYLLLGAEFLAIAQLLVYVGGILVLILFGMMLTHTLRGGELVAESGYRWRALLVVAALGALGTYAIEKVDWQKRMPVETSGNTVEMGSNMKNIGVGLMTDYVLPFELAGILLLVALIGAAWLSGSFLKSTSGK
jgi:NADH:ubiquinone oxidoreductase subunit 6 (subunit J)